MKRLSGEPQTEGLDVIGMGTLSGKILLYSVGKGDLESEMCSGHSDSVNCLSWDLEHDQLFSCSHDSHIVRWNISKGRVKSKWKADGGNVHCITLLPDAQTILSSGRSIKWWDIERQQVLKKFTGHATQVCQLKLVSFPNEQDAGYFLSAAYGDRLLSVWHFNNSDRSALASFSLPDEPVSFDVSVPSSRDEKLLLAAVTKFGTLHIFEHHLNGTCRKPIEPKVMVQIGSNSDKKPKPIPVLSCQVCNDAGHNVAVAYGNFMKVTCEKLPYSSLDRHTYLIRQTALEIMHQEREKQKTTVKTPDVPNDSRVLAPGFLVPSQPVQELGQSQKRRMGDAAEVRQLPMEERLGSLKLSLATSSERQPGAENLAHLLIQGLHSRDEKILDRVFSCGEGTTVLKTVQRLPIEAVMPLLKELHQRLHEKWKMNPLLLKWLRAILSSHMSYLTTCSDLNSLLSPLYQIMDARVGLFQKITHLKGRMDFIMSQVESQKASNFASTESAVLTYQDDSSDDGNSFIDERRMSHSESDYDLLELSESEDEDHDNIEKKGEKLQMSDDGEDDDNGGMVNSSAWRYK